jgi:hypothetical protein
LHLLCCNLFAFTDVDKIWQKFTEIYCEPAATQKRSFQMKTIAICLIACLASSCQRYLTITTPQGTDVHVQGNQIAVMDSTDYRTYYVKDAYKRVNYQGDVYRLLSTVGDPAAEDNQ